MYSSHDDWIRVSRQRPCPVCNKPDNCCISRDGGAVWCGRISEGSIRENAGGQYLHRLDDQPWRTPMPPPPPSPKSVPVPTRNFATMARLFAANAESRRAELAVRLGVDVTALRDLGVGWSSAEQAWTIPERDAEGAVIGLSTRHPNGDKYRAPGSKAGLTYAPTWNSGDGPILLVEGGSDTAALLGLGLNVVGRPSNMGGVALLIQLLAELPDDRAVLVIGERDQKENGLWPGRDGAVKTAEKLAEALERPIGWSLPPDEAKDSRAWLQKMPALPNDRLAALFLDGLSITVIDPPPILNSRVEEGPEIPLEEWRAVMFQVRLDSCRTTGCFLDRSSTGTGKSCADLAVLRQFLGESV